MNRLLALFAVCTFLTAPAVVSACPGDGDGAAAASKASPKTVELAQLAKWVEGKTASVFDANYRKVFEEGHIPGAVHVAYDKVTASVLPKDQASNVVFYCKNEQCGASTKAAQAAIDLGWSNVFVYKAGIDGWVKSGKPVVKVSAAKGKG